MRLLAASLGSFLALVSGVASVGILGVHAVAFRSFGSGLWLVPWGGFVAILCVWSAFVGTWSGAGTWIVGGALLGASAVVAAPSKRALVWGLAAAAVLLGVAAFLEPSVRSRTWSAYPTADVRVVGVTVRGLVDRIQVRGGGPAGFRSYRLPAGVRDVEISLDARSVDLPADMAREAGNVAPEATAATLQVEWLNVSNPSNRRAAVAPSIRITPPDSWTRYAFSVVAPWPVAGATAEHSVAIVRLYVRDGVVLETRNLQMRSSTRSVSDPRPVFGPTRSALHLGSPNLLGHSAAIAALALLALASASREYLLKGVAAVGVVCLCWVLWRSGSRSAWLGLGFGSALLAVHASWFRSSAQWRSILAAVAIFGAGGLATWLARQPGLEEQPARWSIFARAWEGIRAYPWTGLAPEVHSFAAWWSQTAGADASPVVYHAHNLWLHLGAMHGVPGLAAALWLTSSYVWLAHRLAGIPGLVLASSALIMSVFDLSFLFFSVQIPLLLALHALRPGRLRDKVDPRS